MTFSLGLWVGAYQKFPYIYVKKSYGWIKKAISESSDIGNLVQCTLPQISKVPLQSTVIVGHAYGAPGKSSRHSYIDPKVEGFLIKHGASIESVIFTGDVFGEPSLKKWNKLSEQFSDSFALFVAPGNHDVARLDDNEVLQQSSFGFDRA